MVEKFQQFEFWGKFDRRMTFDEGDVLVIAGVQAGLAYHSDFWVNIRIWCS